MKLYDGGRAPNPRRTRIFLAEKGIEIERESVEFSPEGLRSDRFTAINPLQRVPVLVLDDGTAIAESMAICRYFEALQPEPSLFGRDPLEIATIEMWNRRAELNLLQSVAHVFRHQHPAMKELEVPQVPEWGEANRAKVDTMLRILDLALADRPFIAGDRYSVADITAQCAVDFMKPGKMAVPDELENLKRWHGEVSLRPSAGA